MKYGKVAGVKKPVSRIVQGCMMIGDKDRQEWSNELLDAAFSAGITSFDHAHGYGGGACERAIGNWMRERGNRENVMILDKGCHPHGGEKRVRPEIIESDIADSLERLNTEYIDLWLFHRDDPEKPVGPLVETLNKMVDSGKIHAFGGSNWTFERIEEANEYAEKHSLMPFAASSPNFSLAAQIDSPWGSDCITVSGPSQEKARAWYGERDFPVFSWSSLARGFFSGRLTRANLDQVRGEFEDHTIRCYVCEENLTRLDRAEELGREKGLSVPQIALSYVQNYPMNVFSLVGAHSGEEINANIKALDTTLTEEEVAWLDLKRDSR